VDGSVWNNRGERTWKASVYLDGVFSKDCVWVLPQVLPPYLKRTYSIEELLSRLHLKWILTGDFAEASGCFAMAFSVIDFAVQCAA
jgi:hypothetical protein